MDMCRFIKRTTLVKRDENMYCARRRFDGVADKTTY